MNGKLIAALNEPITKFIQVSIHTAAGTSMMIFTHAERCDDTLVFTRAGGGETTIRLLDAHIDCNTIEYSDGVRVHIEVA